MTIVTFIPATDLHAAAEAAWARLNRLHQIGASEHEIVDAVQEALRLTNRLWAWEDRRTTGSQGVRHA